MNRARETNVARLRRLAAERAEQRELRALRKTIDRYGDVLLGLQTREGFAPLCSEPLTAEEMAQLEQTDDFQDACDEARERFEALCKGGSRGAVSEKGH